jgi:hypothetical protein
MQLREQQSALEMQAAPDFRQQKRLNGEPPQIVFALPQQSQSEVQPTAPAGRQQA